MKKFILLLFAVALIFSASLASAEGLYVSGNIGATMPTDSTITEAGLSVEVEYDNGFAFGGAVGYDLGNNARVEGEITYRASDLDTATMLGVTVPIPGELNITTFLLNGYYDIKVDAPVTPFITGGIGFANVELEIDNESWDDDVFAFQVGAGLGYAVNDQVTVDCGYRYMGSSDPEFDTAEGEYGSHNFYVGLRYAIK